MSLAFKRHHTRDVISIGKTSHKLNKDLSHLGQLSPGMPVNTRYINSYQRYGTDMQSSIAVSFNFCFTADGACQHVDFDQLVTLTCKAVKQLLSSSVSEQTAHVDTSTQIN